MESWDKLLQEQQIFNPEEQQFVFDLVNRIQVFIDTLPININSVVKEQILVRLFEFSLNEWYIQKTSQDQREKWEEEREKWEEGIKKWDEEYKKATKEQQSYGRKLERIRKGVANLEKLTTEILEQKKEGKDVVT